MLSSSSSLSRCIPVSSSSRQIVGSFSSRRIGLPSQNLVRTIKKKNNKGMKVTKSDLEPDNISVLVAGGSGVAMDVFRQMTAAGTWVTVLQRHEDNRKEV